jgi:DNA-binding response OmpR family regulator
MRLLIAEDDPVSRRLLASTLGRWGYEVQETADGAAAWQALQSDSAPPLAILDWMMPKPDGLEICRRVREQAHTRSPYLILLTAREGQKARVAALDGGADDFLCKPFDRDELRARLKIGVRIVELQRTLAERVQDLEEALANVKQLQGMLPICAWCKKVRDDQNYWHQVEAYIASRTLAQFTHGICPECLARQLKPTTGPGVADAT